MVTYKRYDALNLAVSEIEKLGGTESYPTPDEYTNASYSMLKKIPLTPIDVPRSIPPGSEVVFFRTWAAILVNCGINIDNRIDDLTNELIACRDGWLSNKRKLEKILNALLEMRHSVRNFEVEV